MTDLDEHGRPEPPLAGDEAATLLGFLDYQRATLAWKCSGLDPAGLRVTVAASSITLGGLLKHLAYVEDDWFSRWLHGQDRRPPWDTVDWKADPDWDWHSAAGDTPEQLFALWGTPWPAPAPWPPRRWPTAAWTDLPGHQSSRTWLVVRKWYRHTSRTMARSRWRREQGSGWSQRCRWMIAPS